jgi:hypothetical protein
LLLVEAAEDEIDVVVKQAFGLIVACGAVVALAFVNSNPGHRRPSMVKAARRESVY